jgi:hypothetical protein
MMVKPLSRLPKAGFATLVALFLSVPAANAGQWYRYLDDNGVPVLSHEVPAEYATRGYTVVDDSGRVLREVARQLSPEERVVREKELAQQAEVEAQRLAAAQRDRELMQLYASPQEVEFARDRKLASIDEMINTLMGEVQQLRKKQHLFETQAADKERSQLPVSKEIISNLETVRQRIAETLREIEARQRERSRTLEDFDRDMKRVHELYGIALPSVPEPPATNPEVLTPDPQLVGRGIQTP